MGRTRIVNKLPEFTEQVHKRAARGLNAALVVLGSESAGRAPQDTSTLINSQIRSVRKEGDRVIGSLGFTAEYALAVHEAPGTLKGRPRPMRNGKSHGVFWGPHGEPEFLKKGAEAAEPSIRAALIKALKP